MGGTDVKNDGCAALWFFGPIHLALSKLHGHEISSSKPTAHLERCNTWDVTVILHLWPLMKNTCADLNFLCVLSWTKNKAEGAEKSSKKNITMASSNTEGKSWTMKQRNEEFSSSGSGLKGLVFVGGGVEQSSADRWSFQPNNGSVDSKAQNCYYSRTQSHSQPERCVA